MYVGVDIVEIEKIRNLLKREKYINQIFTDNELKFAENYKFVKRTESLAGSFAVKEATAKALGTGFSQGVRLIDIENLRDPTGNPFILLHEKALKIANEKDITKLAVSISHCESYAVAMVVFT